MIKSHDERKFDVVVCGGGPVGLATALEVAKAGKRVVLLERFTLFNYSGSSGDLMRMFRLMYTENYLADLALEARKHWQALEREAGETLILATGLLNFGDPDYGDGGPEGTLLGPIDNLKRLRLPYQQLGRDDIQRSYPFKDLPEKYIGIFQPDCGCINVPLLLRTLHKLGKHHGVEFVEYARVVDIKLVDGDGDEGGVLVGYRLGSPSQEPTDQAQYVSVRGSRAVLTAGAYSNHVLRPLGIQLDLQIWEMVYAYYSTHPEEPALFPSMWFHFAEDIKGNVPGMPDTPNLFYGFPSVPWGPANMARIAADSATRIIADPSQRRIEPSAEDLQITQDFVRRHLRGVNLLPNLAGTCLQTNVHDNNFVLDFVPNTNKKVVVFCAGWAMKFVPLLGIILRQLALEGETTYDISHFRISREGVIRQEGEQGQQQEPAAQAAVRHTGSALPRC